MMPVCWAGASGTSCQPAVRHTRTLAVSLLKTSLADKKWPLREKRRNPHHTKGTAKLVTAWRVVQSQMVSCPEVLPAASHCPSGDSATPQLFEPREGRHSVG